MITARSDAEWRVSHLAAFSFRTSPTVRVENKIKNSNLPVSCRSEGCPVQGCEEDRWALRVERKGKLYETV